jgi:hypothetical protein
MSAEGPQPTGRKKELSLTGKLIPWYEGRPSYLNVPDSDTNYLPVFTAEEQLDGFLERAKVPYDDVKQITDGDEFVNSIPAHIIIMVDPYFTPQGRVRWCEVKRN